MTRGTLVGTTSRQAPFSLPPEWKLHFRLGLFKVMFLRDKDWAQVVKTNHFPLHYFTLGQPPEKESVSSAQAKPISEVLEDFEQSLRTYRPSTRRVYVAGARAAIRAASLELWQSPSATELLASIGRSPTEKRARISPFLDFLGGGGLKQSASGEDSAALQNWVIQRIAKQMRVVKNPSITSRRDSGLIAALCAAPARGTPRRWPQNCLRITKTEVLLWEVAIQEPCLALALRFWSVWRERLARPDQRRLYRKSLGWTQSSFLFPGPNGAPLSRAALHNALRRLSTAGERNNIGPITPEKIRAAFLLRDPL